MPPKSKFTKEEVVAAALEIIRALGCEALTARELGARLGSSPRPIFTLFQSMEEVQACAIEASKEIYNSYIKRGLNQTPPFKGVGKEYIRFAQEEPKLFQLLFMAEQETLPTLADALNVDENITDIRASVMQSYQMNERDAQHLYQHLWIYTHGIASLCATHFCSFDTAEIDDMITEVFRGLITNRKDGTKNDSNQ